jgi:two-component system, OmpR family, sensor histidine kinase MtrB
MNRLGLRARITATVAIGALVLSTAIAVLSYQFIRTSMLQERQRVAQRTAFYNASLVGLRIAGPDPDYVAVLSAFQGRQPVLLVNGSAYGLNTTEQAPIPPELAALVEAGQPAQQIVREPDGPALIVGVPLPDNPDTQYYEIVSLRDTAASLDNIGLILGLVAAGVTLAGAGLGWYTGRRALRPLASVAEAARGIAAGDLTARLDPQTEPDLERLTASFNGMVDQLQKRIERDRRFAADVSHELRSPLQTLAAAAAVLERRRASLDARSADAAQLVVEEVERFQHLVTDLLEITRADGKLDLSDVDVLALARDKCDLRNIDPAIVTVLDRSGDATWRADPRRVDQILGNLLENAQRHGGGPVAVRLYREGSRNVIEVDDDGPGVLPESRELIFRPFVRGATAERRGDSEGVGLGLAIVARLAESHGGHACVRDRPGGGARFRVELAVMPS